MHTEDNIEPMGHKLKNLVKNSTQKIQNPIFPHFITIFSGEKPLKKYQHLKKAGKCCQMWMSISQWISVIKICLTSNIKLHCTNIFNMPITKISFLAGK